MKTITLLLIGAFALVEVNPPVTQLSNEDRKYAVGHLTDTKNQLLKDIAGLSHTQLNFKADSTSWSVAECVEHIAIAEVNIFGLMQQGLAEEANPARRSEIQITDEKLLEVITDRREKFQAPETFKPSNSFGSYEATVKAFTTKRNEHIEYLKTTQDDLRNHYNQLPFGLVDTYQTILFMSGHAKRHTLQIEEVMAHKDFPKK